MNQTNNIKPAPGASPFKMWLARFLMAIFGWGVGGEVPECKKYVIAGAPHTSNWDWVLSLFSAYSFGIKMHWVAKSSLFRFPIKSLLKFLGGVPVDRSSRHNFVDQMVHQFENSEEFALAILPEGTRKKVEYWKTGFYYIALKAKVPILFTCLNYKAKKCYLGPLLEPTGDIEADFEVAREYFREVYPKHPEKYGGTKIKPKEEA